VPSPSGPPARPELASSPSVTTLLGAVQLGRYELLAELASGGMATVYVGRQRGAGGFERLVAIKRMHPHLGALAELAAAFMDEARIASLVRHPNVVNVHDVHETGGEYLLVMDYVDGASLANVMRAARKRGERIGRAAAIRIAIESLHGLHAAHEQHDLEGKPLAIVHRDATPHNILLGVDGSVRLTDFGIAKAAQRSVQTATGLAKGKFRYMAPEQARGAALDRRVDVFAMGIVCWELLTGRRLFEDEGDSEVLLTIAAGNYRTPRSVEPSVAPELEQIVMRALAFDANDRWPTARWFADALEGWARANGELCSGAEISRLVDELAGPEIRRRRQHVADVVAGRAPPVRLGPGPAGARDERGTGSSAATSAPLTVDSAQVVRAVTPSDLARRRSRRRLAALALSLAVTSLGAVVLVVRGGSEAPPAEPSASPMPPAVAEPAADRVRVQIASDRDLIEIRAPHATDIRLGDREAELSLPRSNDPLTIVLRFADGAELSEQVIPRDNTAIRVRSPARAEAPAPTQPERARPAARPPGAAKPAPATAGGLEANPYE
jgi:eukaryotic-like serine/threonine-protein kinase